MQAFRFRSATVISFVLAQIVLLGPGTSSGAASADPALWVRARVAQPGCVARLLVRVGSSHSSITVRGARARRYETGLPRQAGAQISIRHQRRSACRAIVLATGPKRGTGERPAVTSGSEGGTGQPPAIGPIAGPTPGQPPPLPTANTGPVIGTFNVVGASQMRAWAASGGNAVVVPVVWGQAQPVAGGEVSLATAGNGGQNVAAEIEDAREAGLAVYLELDLQYPPAWVKESVPQYVNQAGQAYSSSTPGEDVRDWVWSQAGRAAVADFAAKTIGALRPQLSDVTAIRIGGGTNGEMQFPDDGSSVEGQPSFWGYGTAPQTGLGLAAGEEPCPLPSYVYGHGTAEQDSAWASWYFDSLGSFVHWYVQQLRADGWAGPVYVLHPSYGLREDWAPRSAPYELQVALGTDFAAQMDAYDDLPNVWPWATWADAPEPYYSPGDAIDSDMAPWRKILQLARQRGLAAHLIGENTGGGGAAAIERLMEPLGAGYSGVFYLDYPSLTDQGGTLLDDLFAQLDRLDLPSG